MKAKKTISLILAILVLVSLLPMQLYATTDLTEETAGEYLADQVYSMDLGQRIEFVALIQLFIDSEGTEGMCAAFTNAFLSAFNKFTPSQTYGNKSKDLVLTFVDFYSSNTDKWNNAKLQLTSTNEAEAKKVLFTNGMIRNSSLLYNKLNSHSLTKTDISTTISKLKVCINFIKWNYVNQEGDSSKTLFVVSSASGKTVGLSTPNNYTAKNNPAYTSVLSSFAHIIDYFGSFSSSIPSISSTSPSKNDRVQLLNYLKNKRMVNWSVEYNTNNVW